jgi:phage terminase large subunit GpA-like protein
MLRNVWYQLSCPHCGEENWLCQSNPTDVTAVDADACLCRSCRTRFWLNPDDAKTQYEYMTKQGDGAEGDEEYDDLDHVLREYVLAEIGRKSPHDPWPGYDR